MSTSEFKLVHQDAYAARARTLTDAADVAARLKELSPDLSDELFSRAIFTGLSGRNETTEASAVTAAGIQQWLRTVEELRRSLAAKQWAISNDRNCPFIRSPDLSISLVVMTGNSGAGKQGLEEPSNQAGKGSVVERYVEVNSQLELFSQEFLRAQESSGGSQVWVLLYHYDKNFNEVRYELSLPTEFVRGKITGWGERLILGSMSNDSDGFPVNKEAPIAPAVVDVLPKNGTYE
jgi:hypothetical protein